MWKFTGVVVTTIGVLAGIANILTYIEQSKKFPEVVAMFSVIISFDLLRLFVNLALVVAILVMLWRQNILHSLFAEHVATQDAHVKKGPAALLAVKGNQVLYPSENGILWEWDEKNGATDPFCPVHGTPLVYKDYMKHVQPSFTDENFLGGTGRFACLVDNQDFVFYEPSTLRIGELRLQAATVLRAKMGQQRR